MVESGVVGPNHESLIERLCEEDFICEGYIRDVMLMVDRGDFCDIEPYSNRPQNIGHNAVINAPYMHASALNLLKEYLVEGANVLDVGSGSGYLTTCMAIMVGETGRVVGIDRVRELVVQSIENIKKNHEDLITSGRIVMEVGDGHEWLSDEVYNVIHVGMPSVEVPPALTEQLAPGGRMLMHIGNLRTYLQIDKYQDGQLNVEIARNLLSVMQDEERAEEEWPDNELVWEPFDNEIDDGESKEDGEVEELSDEDEEESEESDDDEEGIEVASDGDGIESVTTSGTDEEGSVETNSGDEDILEICSRLRK